MDEEREGRRRGGKTQAGKRARREEGGKKAEAEERQADEAIPKERPK